MSMRVERAARSARTLTLVSVILEAVVFAIGVMTVLLSFLFLPFSMAGVNTFIAIFDYSFLLGILWALLNYFFIYVPLKHNELEKAETPALALGIMELLFGGVIPGILLLVAYVRIGDALDPFLRSE